MFGLGNLDLDRPLILVRLILTSHLDESLLQICKDYWHQSSRIPSCFKDLRRAVEKMSSEERKAFLEFIEHDVSASKLKSDDALSESKDWARAEICVLKFSYLIMVSLPTSQPSVEALETLVDRAANVSQTLPEDLEPIMLIAYCLTRLHQRNVKADGEQSPRLLLQATMLARAAVERDTEKQNRPLALLASRLHLNLGLGRVAIQLWQQDRKSVV